MTITTFRLPQLQRNPCGLGLLIDIQRTEQPTFRVICSIKSSMRRHTERITKVGVNTVSTTKHWLASSLSGEVLRSHSPHHVDDFTAAPQ